MHVCVCVSTGGWFPSLRLCGAEGAGRFCGPSLPDVLRGSLNGCINSNSVGIQSHTALKIGMDCTTILIMKDLLGYKNILAI